jgi:hypothetical protein
MLEVMDRQQNSPPSLVDGEKEVERERCDQRDVDRERWANIEMPTM